MVMRYPTPQGSVLLPCLPIAPEPDASSDGSDPAHLLWASGHDETQSEDSAPDLDPLGLGVVQQQITQGEVTKWRREKLLYKDFDFAF